MPNRILKESICTSETIDALSAETETFFYRLMVQCDDFGRMDARPSVVRSKCFPLRLDRVTDKQVSRWLSELQAADLLWIYKTDDRAYLQVTKWDKHQQKRAKHSKYPQPPERDINSQQMLADASNSHREARSENTRIREARSERGASATPAPQSPKPLKSKEQPPSVQAFQHAAGSFPAKALWQSMDEAIGSAPADLSFWGQVVQAWIAKGWNPRNLTGMFDFYKRRELPASNGTNRQPATIAASSKVKYYTDANGNRRPVLTLEQEKIKAEMAAEKEKARAETKVPG